MNNPRDSEQKRPRFFEVVHIRLLPAEEAPFTHQVSLRGTWGGVPYGAICALPIPLALPE